MKINNLSIRAIFFVVVTIVSYTWAVASVYNMVLDHEKKLARMESVPEDIAVIKNEIKSINIYLDKIDRKL